MIAEKIQPTKTLYRGDSSDVERFDIERTDQYALFGRGIYLTDSLEVARDYTVKGDDRPGVSFEGNTEKEAILELLRYFMKEAGYDEQISATKDTYQRQFYALDNQSREDHDAIMAKFEAAVSVIKQKYFQEAKKRLQREKDKWEIINLTTGMFTAIRKNTTRGISSFKVPLGYLKRVYPVEAPMNKKVLGLVRNEFDKHGLIGRTIDMRDRENTQRFPFDDWMQWFPKNGSRYAWTDNSIGGEGVLPSVDEVINGTHVGGNLVHGTGDNNFWDSFRIEMQKLGYVGLVYQGGIRVAGSGNRGGGGLKHNAYVFWNVKDLEKFRSDTLPVDDTPNLSNTMKYTQYRQVY